MWGLRQGETAGDLDRVCRFDGRVGPRSPHLWRRGFVRVVLGAAQRMNSWMGSRVGVTLGRGRKAASRSYSFS